MIYTIISGDHGLSNISDQLVADGITACTLDPEFPLAVVDALGMRIYAEALDHPMDKTHKARSDPGRTDPVATLCNFIDGLKPEKAKGLLIQNGTDVSAAAEAYFSSLSSSGTTGTTEADIIAPNSKRPKKEDTAGDSVRCMRRVDDLSEKVGAWNCDDWTESKEAKAYEVLLLSLLGDQGLYGANRTEPPISCNGPVLIYYI